MGVCESKEQKERQQRAEIERRRENTCPHCDYGYGEYQEYYLPYFYRTKQWHIFVCPRKPVVPARYQEVQVTELGDILGYFVSKLIIPINYIQYYRNIKHTRGETDGHDRNLHWRGVGLRFCHPPQHPFSYYIDKYTEKNVPFSVHTGLSTQPWKNAINDITTATNFDRRNIVPFLCMRIGGTIITLSSYAEIDEFLDRIRAFVFTKECLSSEG